MTTLSSFDKIEVIYGELQQVERRSIVERTPFRKKEE